IVRSVQSNGTLSVMGVEGPVSVWIGDASHELDGYVDAKLRVRGVLSLSLFEAPVLLVSSRSFVEVAAPAPAHPFATPARAIADLPRETADPSSLHRVRVIGNVTLCYAESFIIQDATGGARVQMFGKPQVNVGDSVEVVGFPSAGEVKTLTDVLVRTTTGIHHIE